MSNNPQSQPGVELAAFRKMTVAPVDLMRPGLGTPWEDRGAIGVVPAYLKTALKSLISPALLMDHIRRPETKEDGVAFMWVSIGMWGIGIFAYFAYWLYGVLPHQKYYENEVDAMHYWLTAAGCAALAGGLIFMFVRIGSRMFLSMAGAELKGVSSALVESCFCYALGPSIFAVVPVVGWAVAAAWIYFDLVVAGKRRLYLKGGGAPINASFIFGGALVLGVVAYFVIGWIWGSQFEMNGLTVHYVPQAHMAAPIQ